MGASDADAETRVVETHTATLFFLGDHVYKLKKAVDLGFLDARARSAREEACHREVELNRRLAPDVYHGVLDVVDEAGEPVDHLVDMRRMPDDRRLARCLERGEDVGGALWTIAHDVAALHARSPRSAVHDALATRDAAEQRWGDGFEQLRRLGLDEALREGLDEMEHRARRYLAGRAPLFDDRIRRGRIRDGHGDLQAEDIFLLDDGPRVLDCIDFDERYRWGDVLADVAFLAMDLERLGHPDLAAAFLAHHRELSADTWPATLAHHHVAYRAHVRAKVEILRSVQAGSLAAAGVGAMPYVALANRHLRDAQVAFVVVGGEPGTGKSTLARELGERLGAVVLRTDEVRQQVAPAAGPDRYEPTAVLATYQELLAEARRLVVLGEHVVLDATWTRPELRERARQLAEEAACQLTELRCVLPRAEADERIRRRQAAGDDPSEATVEVAAALAARFERWPEAVEVSTRDEVAAVADRALAAVARS